MKKIIIKKIGINILVLMLIFLTYKLNIKICPIYNLFSIPCSGCGLTRSFISLLKGDILMSIKYNILTIPLLISYSIYIVLDIRGIIKKENLLKTQMDKYKKYIIAVGVILFVISQLKNIFNPLLY